MANIPDFSSENPVKRSPFNQQKKISSKEEIKSELVSLKID